MAIQLAVILTVLLVAEVFLWLFIPVNLHYEVAVEQNIPGIKSQIKYSADQYGLRYLSMRRYEKPSDVIRILCLGASTTDQPTQNTEDTWCALLEKRLNEVNLGGKIRVESVSFGRGGWRAIDLYAWARTYVDWLKPDVVITLMGINDLAWNGGPGYAYRSINDARIDRGPIIDVAKDICKEYSQLCRRVVLAKRRVDLYIRKKTGRVVEWHSKNLPELTRQYRQRQFVMEVTRTPDPLVEFSDAMDGLVSLLRKARIEVLVLGQSVLWDEVMTPEASATLWFHVNTPTGPLRPSPRWKLAEMRRYNDAQKKIAARHGASYVDLDSRIPKTLEYYFDDCHFTDAGSHLVASVAFSTLKDQVRLMAQKR